MTKKVVVVGAGASSRLVCKTLDASKSRGDYHVTVIQPNKFASLPYFETLVLAGRDTLVENSTFQTVPGSDETVFGVAVACTDGVLSVKLLDEGGAIKEVPFDIIVAATGSAIPTICPKPGQSQEERQKEIDTITKALIHSGKEVVIAGGGAVGVELAGDVLETEGRNKAGTVTLVCSSDRLLPDQPAEYGERCKQVLESKGCKIIFNDRVSSHNDSVLEPTELTLKSGKTLSCQAYIAAYSRGPKLDWLTTAPSGKSSLPSKLKNEKGRIEVNEYLQSRVYDKLYAIGATNNRKEIALAMNVQAQAETAAANIISPGSKAISDGVEHAVYQIVGHETDAFFMPSNMPMPSFCSTLCCQWCGFPFNLLCPCFCCAVVCGPVHPMTCGYCCGKPEGPGLAKTMVNLKDMKVMANNVNYAELGKAEVMER